MANKSIKKNGIFYAVYNFLNILFPLISGIYVSRVLLPINVGEVAAAQNLAQYFVILAFLGIPTYGMREISSIRNNPKEINKLFSELFTINLFSTLFFSLLYLSLIFSIGIYRDNITIYLITGAAIALNSIRIDWLYEGLEEFQYISIRNICFKVISFALLVIVVRSPQDYLWYAAISVIGTTGNYLVNIIHSKKVVHISFNGLNLKRHIKPIFILTSVNIAIEIYSLSDITLLDIFSSKENVAFYSYGNRIYKLLLQIVNSLTIVVVPRLSFFYKNNDNLQFNELLSRAFVTIFLISLPLVVGLIFTSQHIITLLYTEVYISSAFVLMIFSLLLIVSPIGYLLGSRVLLVTNKESKILIGVLVGCIVNIISNLLLIPRFQQYGSAIASLLSEVSVTVILILLSKHLYRLNNIKTEIFKIIVSTLIMSIFLLLMSKIEIALIYKVCIEVICAALLYGIMLLVLKEKLVYSMIKNNLKRFCR